MHVYFFRLLLLVGVFVGLVLLVGSLLPRAFELNESIQIDAPAADVYRHVADLNTWLEWSPWSTKNEALQTTVTQDRSGRQTLSWQDPRGAGKLWIAADSTQDEIPYQMSIARFKEVYGTFTLTSGPPCVVTWTMKGRLPAGPFYGFFQIYFHAEMQRQMQSSLERLKALVQNVPQDNPSADLPPTAEPVTGG